MTDGQSEVVIVLGVVALAVSSIFFGWQLPKNYRERKCAGSQWQREFPMMQKEDIRRYLSVFAKAFGFRVRDKLKFRPDDKLLDIYNKRYPLKGMPDALELETLSRMVKRQYGIELETLWGPELTLGALFRSAARPSAPADGTGSAAPPR
jgi:hypothetical protein